MNQRHFQFQLGTTTIIWLVSLFIVLTGNATFFELVLELYPPDLQHLPFLVSTFVLQLSVLAFIIGLFATRHTIIPISMLLLLLSASVGYYQDEFRIVMDEAIIKSIFETNLDEAADVINATFILRIVLLGILPVLVLTRIKVIQVPLRRALILKAGNLALSLALVAVSLLSFTGFYTTLFREHKIVRYYSNPVTTFHALAITLGHSMSASTNSGELATTKVVKSPGAADSKPRLIIMIVGEAARARNFGINGYDRDTTPYMSNRDILSFQKVTSCGTTTAISVPCIFSPLGEDDFSVAKAANRENLLDVVSQAGVSVYWRDNNSDSKGVALRVPYESYKSADINKDCDIECRDTGMLHGLTSLFEAAPGKDQLVVLHQMGSHGPAYFKRYPEEYKIYTPTCDSIELGHCTPQEITNAYDNSITYTDFFLNEVIDFLETHTDNYDTAMIYVGDHGESLGENGLYLHGIPKMFAPDEQLEVPLIMWYSQGFKDIKDQLVSFLNEPMTHDDIFPLVLALFNLYPVDVASSRLINQQSNDSESDTEIAGE